MNEQDPQRQPAEQPQQHVGEPPPAGSERTAPSRDQGQAAPAKPKRPISARHPTMLSTILDLEACKAVVGRMLSDKEEELAKPRSAPGELKPLKLIEKYKTASPCNQDWKKMPGTDRFRVCQECGLHVYKFKDMDQSEADNLIYQQEGRRKVTYYRRRSDGKFLTSDCPVGVAGKRTLYFLVALAVLLVSGVIAAAIMIPPHLQQLAMAESDAASDAEREDRHDRDKSSLNSSTVPDNPEPDELDISYSYEDDFHRAGEESSLPNESKMIEPGQ